jgi:hypothetical protein
VGLTRGENYLHPSISTPVTYPTFETILAGANQDKLLVLRRSLISIFPRCLLFVVLSLVIAYINFAVATPETYGVFRWLGLIPLAVLIDLVRIQYNDLYIFSIYKITKLEGRISFKYSVPSVSYFDIRGLVVSQGFWGRILGYGDILIGTASTEGHEMKITGLLDPEQLADIIEQFRSLSMRDNNGE